MTLDGMVLRLRQLAGRALALAQGYLVTEPMGTYPWNHYPWHYDRPARAITNERGETFGEYILRLESERKHHELCQSALKAARPMRKGVAITLPDGPWPLKRPKVGRPTRKPPDTLSCLPEEHHVLPDVVKGESVAATRVIRCPSCEAPLALSLRCV